MKRVIKGVVAVLCTILVLPAIVVYRLQVWMGLGTRCFSGWSQLLSLLPGGRVSIFEVRSIELRWIDVWTASGSDSARCFRGPELHWENPFIWGITVPSGK